MATNPIMAVERLTVTTAITGLLAVSSKLADILWNLDTHPITETAPIHHALQQIKQYRSTLHVFYKTLSSLEAGKLPNQSRAGWIEVDNLIALLTDTVLAISDFQVLCERIEDAQESPECESVVLGGFVTPISNLTSRLRWHNLSITMMMTVLKCPGEADARSSQTGLSQRVARLLSSNNELSTRMRALQNFHDSRRSDIQIPPNCDPSMASVLQYQHHLQQTSQQSQTARHHSSSPQSSISASSSSESNPNPDTPQKWSAFTGYSLLDTPLLSMIDLPVTTIEVRDGPFYTAPFAKQMAKNLTGLLLSDSESIEVQTRTKGIKSRKKDKAKEQPSPNIRALSTGPHENSEKGEKISIGKVLVQKLNIRKKHKSLAVEAT